MAGTDPHATGRPGEPGRDDGAGDQPDRDRPDRDRLDGDPNDRPPGYASPPCMMHEMAAAYLGYMDPTETAAMLHRCAALAAAGAASPGPPGLVRAMASLRDTAARGLARIEQPSRSLSVERDAATIADALLALLDDAVPRIADDTLHGDLCRGRTALANAAAAMRGGGADQT